MGRVTGLGGPPRLCHGLRGPRHGGGRPGGLVGPCKLPLNGLQGLKASLRHLPEGHPVPGTCEARKAKAGSVPGGRSLQTPAGPKSFLWPL